MSCVSPGIPYRVVIVPMKKLSIAMATVNPWVCVSGELGDSGVRQMSKNTQEVFFQVCTHCWAVRLTSHLMQSNTVTVVCSLFQCKNLGRLSTLQLGQENSGLLAKCLIDCVMVYNEITGHTYKWDSISKHWLSPHGTEPKYPKMSGQLPAWRCNDF